MSATGMPAPGGEVACSVCIANFNGMDLIDACIDSVRKQSGGIPLEIIVHDDALTDGSVAHIRDRHPDVRLIASKENVGFCVANNRMVAAAQGEYLLLLNNDATLLSDALATLLAEARRLQAPAILSLPQYDADSGTLLDIGSLLDPFFNAVPNRDPRRQDVAMVAGACLWIPKRLWDDSGRIPRVVRLHRRGFILVLPGQTGRPPGARAWHVRLSARRRRELRWRKGERWTTGDDFSAARPVGAQQDLRHGDDLPESGGAIAVSAPPACAVAGRRGAFPAEMGPVLSHQNLLARIPGAPAAARAAARRAARLHGATQARGCRVLYRLSLARRTS